MRSQVDKTPGRALAKEKTVADDDNDGDTSFNRQRRDLFVVTSVLLLIRFSHASFEGVSVQGIGLRLGNPDALIWGLWALWLYWLIRYLQAYHDLTKNPVRLAFSQAYACLLYTSPSPRD